MLIAQLSDIHIGGARHHGALLRYAIAEINEARPDVVVIAGDLTDEGYPDQYGEAREQLGALGCPNVVAVPGNHDSRHVGYLQYERAFGGRDSILRLQGADGTQLALVAVDSSKPDLDEGEIGREHYAWIEEGFREPADLRVFVCHHHLMPIPGTGRERNQVLDAGDVLSLLRDAEVDVVLSGHRHVPCVWPVAGDAADPLGYRCHAAHAGVHTACVQPDPGGRHQDLGRAARSWRRGRSLGVYPRDWPPELSAGATDPLANPPPGPGLAND